MTQANHPLSSIPGDRNMLSYKIAASGESPRKSFVAVFEYPDCTREFDGKNWKVTQDKRPQPARNIFTGEGYESMESYNDQFPDGTDIEEMRHNS
jgi:hypothetical protein